VRPDGNRAARLCALVVFLLLVLVPTTALAKDYSIESVSIGAAIDPNGDLRVTEDRVVTFRGEFSWIQWNLKNKGSDGIDVLGVGTIKDGAEQAYNLVPEDATEAGTYSVTDDGESVTVRVGITAMNQTMPFRINYYAKNAAHRYADTSELYWQFIGDGTSVPTGRVHIEISPPAALTKDQIKAWAHGPLTGTVSIDDNGKVTLDAPQVPANTFVEARELLPADALSGAPVISEARAQTVETEEASWAQAANVERTRVRSGMWLAIALTALVSFGGLAFALAAFARHGREYRPAFPGGYLREDPRPDLPPGVIGALWRFGKPGNADIAATLMDLADKNVIAMRPITVHRDGVLGIGEKDEPSFELGLNPNPPAGVVGTTDRQLLDLLFGDIGAGGLVTLEEIKSFAKDNPRLYTDKIQAWFDQCEAIAMQLGMFEGNSWSWQVGMFLLAGAVGAVAFFATFWGATVWPICMGVPCAITIAVIGVYILRRSRQGNELFAQYKAVHDFLRDFGRLREVPPQSVVLWNRFLVLAVVFGIATEVINQLRVRVPAVVGDAGFQTTYWWVYSSGDSVSPVTSVQGGFANASAIASSAMSSSSGGGGGFSGGGGGGGGGGGFSAG
jgi:uncharacterized membrane protein